MSTCFVKIIKKKELTVIVRSSNLRKYEYPYAMYYIQAIARTMRVGWRTLKTQETPNLKVVCSEYARLS